jgi:hypothetical protein
MLDHRHLTLDAATTDAAYAGRLVSSATGADGRVTSLAVLCMASYLSLFVHESYARFQEIDKQAAQKIKPPADVQKIIARSRHSLKLFEDTNRGVTGQIRYFRDEIIANHHANFIEKIPVPFLRPLGKDLGVFTYSGATVATSHTVTFALGFEPRALLAKGSGTLVRSTMEDYGRYFAEWGASLQAGSSAFPSHMNAELIANRDVRATDEYRRIFNGPATPALNAVLSGFQASLNALDRLVGLDTDLLSLQTTLKLKFLTIYHVLKSLAILLQECPVQLSRKSEATIRSILSEPSASTATNANTRPFRDTLLHYRPDSRIDLSRLSLGRPLYGLVELFFWMSPDAFDTFLTTLVADVASQMNTWAET